jgi:hypothetical protein
MQQPLTVLEKTICLPRNVIHIVLKYDDIFVGDFIATAIEYGLKIFDLAL